MEAPGGKRKLKTKRLAVTFAYAFCRGAEDFRKSAFEPIFLRQVPTLLGQQASFIRRIYERGKARKLGPFFISLQISPRSGNFSPPYTFLLGFRLY